MLKKLTEPFWYLWVALASCHFSLAYVSRLGTNISIPDYVNGAAPVPYQYRVLCAWIMKGLLQIPLVVRLGSGSALLRHSPYLLSVLSIVAPALFLTIVCTRASVRVLTGNENWSMLGGLVVLYMTYFSLAVNYELAYMLPYDIPSLLFFSAAIYLLLTRRYILYYPIFVLATFNRETCILIVPFFAICYWLTEHRNKWKLIAHIGVQVCLWILVKLWLHRLFAGNTSDQALGGLFALRLFFNLKELVKPWQWPPLASIFGFLLPVYVVGFRYIKDRRLAIGGATTLCLWLGAMLIVGNLIEIRIFTEMNSIMALSITTIGYGLWQSSRRA
jgi:hypothetical protein